MESNLFSISESFQRTSWKNITHIIIKHMQPPRSNTLVEAPIESNEYHVLVIKKLHTWTLPTKFFFPYPFSEVKRMKD